MILPKIKLHYCPGEIQGILYSQKTKWKMTNKKIIEIRNRMIKVREDEIRDLKKEIIEIKKYRDCFIALDKLEKSMVKKQNGTRHKNKIL